MPCSSSPAPGQHQHEEEVGEVGHRRLGLPDADRLDQDHVEARRLAEEHRLAGLGGDAAERAGGGRRADEGVRVAASRAMRVLSPRIAPPVRVEDGIDREHGDPVPLLGEHAAEPVDGGRFADPRHAGDADAHRVPVRASAPEQRAGRRAMVGAGGIP